MSKRRLLSATAGNRIQPVAVGDVKLNEAADKVAYLVVLPHLKGQK